MGLELRVRNLEEIVAGLQRELAELRLRDTPRSSTSFSVVPGRRIRIANSPHPRPFRVFLVGPGSLGPGYLRSPVPAGSLPQASSPGEASSPVRLGFSCVAA